MEYDIQCEELPVDIQDISIEQIESEENESNL